MSGDTVLCINVETSMNALKDTVLECHIEFLHEELGDPGRYLPQLRSKGVLSLTDCQTIRSKETFRDKIESLVTFMKGKESSKNEHSFDVLVDALKKQRVQAHIARGLQKALAKAKEKKTMSCGTSNDCFQHTASLQQVRLPNKEEDKNSGHDFHPEHGQLPLPPSGASAQSVDSCSYEASDEDGEHPVFGKLPSSCNSAADEMLVYAVPRSVRWTSNSEILESSSESELGGQSQFSTITSAQISDAIPLSYSTPTGSLSDSSCSSTHHESMEVTKLKAMIQHLNERLQEAYSKLDEKNVKIQELEMKLHQHKRYKEEDGRIFSKDTYRTDVAYPQPIPGSGQFQNSRVFPPCRNNTAPSTISASSDDGFQRRGTETVVYNNYINYSRNSSNNASVSTV